MNSRLLLALVGFWLGMLVASWFAATLNFRTVDRVLGPDARPELEQRLAAVATADRRSVLRHLASEINRSTFRDWPLAQLALGALALAIAWRQGGHARLLLAVALALVLVQAVGLTRPITELGRAIDFLPRPLPPATARQFGMLHAAYVGSDLLKACVLAAALWSLVSARGGGAGS